MPHLHPSNALPFALTLSLTAAAFAAPLPRFFSSDSRLDALANDLFLRHARIDYSPRSLRYDREPGLVPTAGQTLWKAWEVDSLCWFDYSSENFPLDDRPGLLEFGLRAPIDRFGYVYSAASDAAIGSTFGPQVLFGYGWPFPDYPQSDGRSVGWEFDGSGREGWTVLNAGAGTVSAGEWRASANAVDPILLSPTFSVDSFHAPLLSLAIQYDTVDPGALPQERHLQIFWTTQSEPFFSEDKSVRSDQFAARPFSVSTGPLPRQWFPMYLHPKWRGETITQIRIDPIANLAGQPRTASWRLDYLRLSYDTRHAVNNPVFIIATARKFFWDGDTAFLREQLPRLRAAMQFMLTHMRADDFGLLDQGFFANSGGRGHTAPQDGAQLFGGGVGSNYFDILPCGPRSLPDNVGFYTALQEMAKIEDFIDTAPFLDSEPPTIDGAGGEPVTYSEDGNSLRARRPAVRQAIHDEFWNEETGRYGVWRNSRGELVDYGYAHFNLEALEVGIPEQHYAQQILSWLDGERIISGDTAAGGEIYDWRFAARVSTRRNEIDYFWQWRGWTVPFGEQVQDGGAVLWTTYYDVLGRLRYEDAEGAWRVWNQMLDHHEEVIAFGGEGAFFYRDYYAANPGSLQGGGTAGGLGLDREFIENFLVPSAWRRGWAGVDAVGPRTLQIAPTLPPGLQEVGIENVVYRRNVLRIRAAQGEIDLRGSSITNTGAGTLRLIFDRLPGQAAQVLRDGEPVSEGVVVEPDRIMVETPPNASLWQVAKKYTHDGFIIQ